MVAKKNMVMGVIVVVAGELLLSKAVTEVGNHARGLEGHHEEAGHHSNTEGGAEKPNETISSTLGLVRFEEKETQRFERDALKRKQDAADSQAWAADECKTLHDTML